MLKITLNRKTGERTVENIKSDVKADYDGVAKFFGQIFKEACKMEHLRKEVKNKIGEFKQEEWEHATLQMAKNNIMADYSHRYDQTAVDTLILNIDFYRRHNLGVQA